MNEEPRPLADGDYAVVSLESLSGVAEKISQDEIMLKIGDEATLPAFTENLRGASLRKNRASSTSPIRKITSARIWPAARCVSAPP